MATSTYVALATTTLSSNSGSVTFSSIPATYRNLVCVINGNGTTTTEVDVVFNSDTNSANYPSIAMQSQGAGSGTSTQWIGYFLSIVSNQTIIHRIIDYTATDKQKTTLFSDDRPGNNSARGAVRWANTAAITQIEYRTPGGQFTSGTTLSLYGIEG